MSELSPEAKRLFTAAREAYSPSESRVEALQASLQARIAAETATASTTTATASTATTAAKVALVAKVAAVLGVVTAVVVGASMLGGPEKSATPTAVPPAAALAAAPLLAQPAAVLPSAAPTSVLAPAAKPRVPFVVPQAVRAVAGASAAQRTVRKGASLATSQARATRSDLASAAGASPSAQREAAQPEAAQPAPAPAQLIEPEPALEELPVVTRDALDAEIHLLRMARAALERGDPERALAALDEHAEQHSSGTLTQERLATRALALCELGRVQSARSAVRELLRLSPRSPHLSRLRSSCAWPEGK